jgi:hypothetical protein
VVSATFDVPQPLSIKPPLPPIIKHVLDGQQQR